MPRVSVAEAKSHFSELIAKSAHSHERFVITRRDKPVAALVSIEDLKIIEQHQERQGLAAAASSWPDFEEVATPLTDLEALRREGGSGRDVSF
ncbi:MAG TPA: type II toxin-antitoxin system Phd/YefM family antitoxin [Desulfobacteraceae bacterium]|nr:type II toxin-antitoxin system Phd/YefM family antitoxin [Desulfobacteraceae bacterium]